MVELKERIGAEPADGSHPGVLGNALPQDIRCSIDIPVQHRPALRARPLPVTEIKMLRYIPTATAGPAARIVPVHLAHLAAVIRIFRLN